MSYTRTKTVNFGSSRAGLATVGYTLRNADGTVNTARSTSGVVEIGTSTGMYGAPIPFPAAFVGYLEWDTGDGSPVYATEEINPGSDEYTDTPVSSRAVAGSVTLSSPIAQSGALTLHAGDTYAAGVQVVLWSLAAGTAPDLTGATVTLEIANLAGTQGTGRVVTSSASAAQQVAVDFTAAQTAALLTALAARNLPGSHYALLATLTNGAVITLARGPVQVLATP